MIESRRTLLLLGFVRLMWPDSCFADEASEWFGRVGALGAIYHSSATVSTPAGRIPGATANVTNSFTGIFEAGYDPTENTYILFMAGIPPKPSINGRGTIAALDKLGAVRYGPVVLTAGYRLPSFGKLQPYVGAGVAYAIILREHDAAVSSLNVHNNFGAALQVGAEYAITDRSAIFLDAKQLRLSVNADGTLNGSVPVHARVNLNPTLLSGGVKFKF